MSSCSVKGCIDRAAEGDHLCKWHRGEQKRRDEQAAKR
jgi:hypothetical protein